MTGAERPAGLRVLLTRPEGDGLGQWERALRQRGEEPLLYPTIEIVPPASWEALDCALNGLQEYHWLIFTSATAVHFVVSRLPGSRLPAAAPPQIAAIGGRTAAAVVKRGGLCALVANDTRQEGLFQMLRSIPTPSRFLLPQAAGGRSFLAQSLRELGQTVDVVTAYETIERRPLPALPVFDLAVFASPSALRAFVAAHGTQSIRGGRIIVIGTTTLAQAVEFELDATCSKEASVDGIFEAIARWRLLQGVE